MKDFEAFVREDPKKLFKKSKTYKILNETHNPENPLKLADNGFIIPAKYCPTCKFYRPQRATHGSKTGCCIQRYDHFCAWLGTDVALHNHGWFYHMLFAIFLSMCFAFLIAAMVIITCVVYLGMYAKNIVNNLNGWDAVGDSAGSEFFFRYIPPSYLIFAIFCSAVVLGGGGFLQYSVLDLIKYHHTLLPTATLTKED